MPLRPLLLRTHRWLGLSLGLLIALIALTGAASVALSDCERWACMQGIPGEGRAPFAAAVDAIATAIPGAQVDNYFPAEAPGRPDHIETVLHAGEAKESFTVFCDPATGRVLGDTRGSTCIAAMRAIARFHATLLLPEAAGRPVLGALAVALLLFAASGLWLWATMAPVARTAAGHGTLVLHRLVAAAALPVLIASACTGMLFGWQWSRPLVHRALGGDAASLPYFAMSDAERAAFRGTGIGTPLGIDELVAAARAQPAAAGCGPVLRITSLASKAAKPVKIVFDYPGNGDRRAGGVVLQIDRITGTPSFIDDPRGRSPGNWLMARQWAFHAGRWVSSSDAWGIIARWAWILGGIGVAAVAVTGAALWSKRRGTAGG